MAMEQLEVPSKSYFIRWVDCPKNYTISWSVHPSKKSLNFGIFKHPTAGGQGSSSSLQPPSTARSDETSISTKERRPANSRGRSNEGDCIEKLHAAGLLDVYWHGKCEAEKVTTGTYAVKEGGMYALVFDNSFSKQIAKQATLVLLTYPTNSAPPASHALHHYDSNPAMISTTSLSLNNTPTLMIGSNASVETMSIMQQPRDDSFYGGTNSGFLTGVLKKRKRKRHQGYARRFFSLDFTSSTLSYYLNPESSTLRGAIPLSLAVTSANQHDKEICIDSGAEVWHLRANDEQDWERWKTALERATQQALKAGTTGDEDTVPPLQPQRVDSIPRGQLEAGGWADVEALVGRVSGIRDAVRRLATAPEPGSPRPSTSGGNLTSSAASIMSVSPMEERRMPFWKRKGSGGQGAPIPTTLHPRDAGRNMSISSVAGVTGSAAIAAAAPNGSSEVLHRGENMNIHLNAILSGLDSVVEDFSRLVAENKQRRYMHRMSTIRAPSPMTHRLSKRVSRMSMGMESDGDDEFFDAEDALDEAERGKVVLLNDDQHENTQDEGAATDDDESDAEDDSFDDNNMRGGDKLAQEAQDVVEEGGVRNLKPLPCEPVKRREVVPPPTVLPPSLIGFLRKNVGKDLSTIAMPVSANEPTSLLQRLAEQLEYSELLDDAVNASEERGERLLYVAAFATSSFSNSRVKDRSIRKPFNPMLGETFELVREDKGFRFIAEKVCHRPVIMACHAESQLWTFTQCPMPTQKFWGKSAELNTSGRVRIHFPTTGDSYSWTIATSFLRNIIAGEKYVEPVGTMTIHHENTGEKATVTFKANKGMFAGRSEDLTIQAFNVDGEPYPLSLVGKWTEELIMQPDNRVIWSAGELVEASNTRYGFTRFAATLNEITPIEEGHIPITDTRLRPDQRMVEEGKLDEAEEEKVRLEEGQRQRRKEMEDNGEQWQPRWFTKVREYENEEIWKIRTGEDGYWEQRARGEWENVPELF
ncbi:Oxysterol-binding protein-domain-containing protein [Morchella snyderi]|nr:Oxysterol-binding protein-domain-containing protein [Morchella snyderi]